MSHIIKECRHLYEQERTNLNLTKTLDEITGPNQGENMIIIKILKLARSNIIVILLNSSIIVNI